MTMKMAVEHLGRRMVSHANQNSVASSYLGPAGKCPVGHTTVRYIPSLLPSFFPAGLSNFDRPLLLGQKKMKH